MVAKVKKYASPAIIVVLLFLLIIQECHRRHEKTVANVNLNATIDSITYFKNRLGMQTASVKVLQLDKKTLNDLILKKDRQIQKLKHEFASVKSVAKFKSVIKLDTLQIRFKKDVPCNFTITDSVRSKFYSFSYSIDSTGIQLKDFNIPNETTVMSGFKRKWLLGRQTLTTDVTHSNPYIRTESILSAEVILQEPWYKKWYLWLLAGVISGVLIK